MNVEAMCIGRIVGMKLKFNNCHMPPVEAISQIIVCYDIKPNIPFRHIECDMNGEHIDFTYKTYVNYGNTYKAIRHRLTLYIGTMRANKDDLLRMCGKRKGSRRNENHE